MVSWRPVEGVDSNVAVSLTKEGRGESSTLLYLREIATVYDKNAQPPMKTFQQYKQRPASLAGTPTLTLQTPVRHDFFFAVKTI